MRGPMPQPGSVVKWWQWPVVTAVAVGQLAWAVIRRRPWGQS